MSGIGATFSELKLEWFNIYKTESY
jgi:hypothetical protein